MELEFERFRTIVQITSGWVVNQDIDLAGLCKRLDERMTSTFETNEGDIVSPMLEQVVSYLHGSVNQLMQDPVIKQQPQNNLVIIMKERANFHLRCNTLKSYALLLLLEINNNTEEISEAFEEWIITSVKKENHVAAHVVKVIEAEVKQDSQYLDGIKVQSVNLDACIQRVQLDEGLPQYLSRYEVPKGLDASRLTIETLKLMFNQLKGASYQDLLDSQTFLSIIIGNYQAYKVPDRWRTLSFGNILSLVTKFAKKPPSNMADRGTSPFASSLSMGEERSQYINWKKMFILFALSASVLPTDD